MTEKNKQIISNFDATDLIGLPIELVNIVEVYKEDGEEYIKIPNRKSLNDAAAFARCLIPVFLGGKELKNIRKILGLNGKDFAKAINMEPATLSRWENDNQALGGFAEKIIRIFVCETLAEKVPGIAFKSTDIIRMDFVDRTKIPEEKLPKIRMESIRMKARNKIISAWSEVLPEAA